MTPIHSSQVWFAVQDSTILERVVVVSTVIFPQYGKFILYKQIDWPDSGQPLAHCCHEDTFRQLYSPQDESCETQAQENSSSRISLPRPQPWYTALVRRWLSAISPNKDYW